MDATAKDDEDGAAAAEAVGFFDAGIWKVGAAAGFAPK